MKIIPVDKILVFRSDIKTAEDKCRISEIFNRHPAILSWNVDFDDDEYVLRVISDKLSVADIVLMVKKCEYNCQELED